MIELVGRKKLTCLIGMRLIDGVIGPSIWFRLFCASALPIIDWELVGALELESVECGDGDPPFSGRWIVEHDWMSRTEFRLVGIGSDCVRLGMRMDYKLPAIESGGVFFFVRCEQLTLNESLSAMDISTCGVRKCIGGVPFSLDRIESCKTGVKSNEFDDEEKNFGGHSQWKETNLCFFYVHKRNGIGYVKLTCSESASRRALHASNVPTEEKRSIYFVLFAVCYSDIASIRTIVVWIVCWIRSGGSCSCGQRNWW